MEMNTKVISAVVCATLASVIVAPAFAEAPPPEFIQFQPSASMAALYRPDPEAFPDAHIGVIAMHRDSNFMSHISTRELSARGFYTLGINTRCDNNEAACAPWEDNALDLAQGVELLRSMPEITHVVLIGASGGGPASTFYQAVAEAGQEFCQDQAKITQCGEGFESLPAVDGIMLMDAHTGNTVGFLRSINPSVTNDVEIMASGVAPQYDEALDPFSEENGFSPEGSTYSAEFVKAYTDAQSERINTLVDIALERLAYVEENDLGDAPFIIPLASGARIMQTDLSIHAATNEPRNLVLNDGSVVSDEVVNSVRVPTLSPGHPESFDTITTMTLRSFLSVFGIRSTNSMDGIDWCSSNNSTPCNVQQISVPLLVTAMGGHYFIRDNEQIFEMAASEDKEFYVIEGASHGGTPCTACEETEGQYSNATANLFDLMAGWMNERF